MMRIFKIIFVFLFVFTAIHVNAQEVERWKIEDMKKAISSTTQPTVFSFWATFCKPCIGEIPHFQEIVKQYNKDSVKLILVSLDLPEMYPARIRTFAKKFRFDVPLAWLDETNADLFCPAVDERWSGSIPATLFINNKTGYRNFFEEELSRKTFEEEVKKLINKQP